MLAATALSLHTPHVYLVNETDSVFSGDLRADGILTWLFTLRLAANGSPD